MRKSAVVQGRILALTRACAWVDIYDTSLTALNFLNKLGKKQEPLSQRYMYDLAYCGWKVLVIYLSNTTHVI